MKKKETPLPGCRQEDAATTVLELNLISAQELGPAKNSKEMNTYVVAYIDPAEKLSSSTSTGGGANPSWNEKMIFKLDVEDLRRRPDICIVIEIYRARRNCLALFLAKKDKRMGYVHIRLHDMIGQSSGVVSSRAFLVRRTSGEPVGILNLALVGLDGVFHHLRPRTGVVFRRRLHDPNCLLVF